MFVGGDLSLWVGSEWQQEEEARRLLLKVPCPA